MMDHCVAVSAEHAGEEISRTERAKLTSGGSVSESALLW